MTEEPTEPPVEEEEEELPDNTTNRDDILNSQPKDYNEWIEYINNLEITVPDVQDIDFNDEEEIFAHIPIIIDACQYIYNTRNYRLESYANISNDLYTTYKGNYDNLQSKYKALEEKNNIVDITLDNGKDTIQLSIKKELREKTTDRYRFIAIKNESLAFDHALVILAGIERIRNEHFDLLLLDFMMTPLHGDDVVDDARGG